MTESSVAARPGRAAVSGFPESSGCREGPQTSEAGSEMPREIIIQKWMDCEQKPPIYMWSQERF